MVTTKLRIYDVNESWKNMTFFLCIYWLSYYDNESSCNTLPYYNMYELIFYPIYMLYGNVFIINIA